MMKPMCYIYSGPVHAGDHDPRCFVSGVQNQPQGLQEVS